jgi:superfamily I DNA/RNA helicase
VGRFCYSAARDIDATHVPSNAGLDSPDQRGALVAAVLPVARRAWEDITSRDGRLPFTHDAYLKIWELSRPRLDYDAVFLDEAQDSNPVVSDIVEGQTDSQRVMVGDRCQAIYGWRGAQDAMSRFPADQRLYLSQSFRFGKAVAAEANKWLAVLRSPLRLQGFERINSVIEPLPTPTAILCRTNAEAVAQVMAATDAGRRPALVGGGKEIRRLAEAAITLKAGIGTDHPELFAFRTWAELQEYVEHDDAGNDLKVFVRLIDQYGPDTVISTVDRLVEEHDADVVVSTAHKAKGREWSTVRIAADFREPGDEQPEIPREDAMLAYVAVTRARLVLDRSGLAWIDRWIGGSKPRPTNRTSRTVQPGE